MEEEEEEERREAAIAATPSLQPNFKSSKLTPQQINKFKELHRRRLQIKERLENKFKGNSSGAKVSKRETKANKEEDSSVSNMETANCTLNSDKKDKRSLQQGKETTSLAPKKRQKLHWGLDTKERWERKANM